MSLANPRAVRRAGVLLVAGTLLILPVGTASPAAASQALPASEASTVIATEVTIYSGETALPGTVVAPAGDAPERAHPGVVIVHDAGPRTRDTYEPEARALAAAGVVTLIYDKRTTGYSLTNRSFPALAGDAAAASPR